MGAREQRHAGRRRSRLRVLGLVADLLVVLVVVAAVANSELDLGHRWFGLAAADPGRDPAAVRPPEGLDLPTGDAPPAVAAVQPPGSVDPAAVRRAVAPLLRDPDLGKHLAVAVSEVGTGRVVLQRGAGAVTPASTTKLLTSAAALETLGPTTRFTTRVVASGRRVVLVGGGDPFLMSSPRKARGQYPARADLETLARASARALTAAGTRRVVVGYDASLFTGPAVNPHWPATYVPEDVVPPIAALWADEARDGSGHYVADPAATAASVFAKALARAGVVVVGAQRPQSAPAGGTEVAKVESATVGEIVQQTLAVSDNNAAEVLARHVGAATGDGASFAGGSTGVMATLRDLGVPVAGSEIHDGSGLSRENQLTPATLLGVLQVAASGEHPELREVLTGLPVAGFTGSLQARFDQGPAAARGRVRAKTGTLTGVHGLAGLATDVDGNLMAFVLVADRVRPEDGLAAQHQLDLVAAALGACRCGVQQ